MRLLRSGGMGEIYLAEHPVGRLPHRHDRGDPSVVGNHAEQLVTAMLDKVKV